MIGKVSSRILLLKLYDITSLPTPIKGIKFVLNENKYIISQPGKTAGITTHLFIFCNIQFVLKFRIAK